MSLLVHPGLVLLPGRSVRFTLRRPEAHTVRLAADFTRWSTAPLALNRTSEDMWEVESQPLADGVHFYKYIVDGHWMHDPAHPMIESDGCGGWNSIFGLGGPSLGEPSALRIASLNLRTYQESEPLLKLEQVAFALASMGVDAVALQEVGEHVQDPERPNAGEFIRRRLQELTGRPWEHAWRMAHLGFDVFREGVSILASTPLIDVREYRLSQGRLARNALAATITIKGTRLRLVSTHVTWPSGSGLREVQLLLDGLRAEPPNALDGVLIAGDLNAAQDEPQIKALLDEGYADVARQAGGNAFPTATPQVWQQLSANGPGFILNSRIDYQLLRTVAGGAPVKPLACVPIFNGLTAGDLYQPRVSDHIGLLGVYSQ
jgi:endonuclease/exonuclease/phosphatase family metal-dependent hydrolase